MTSIHLPAVCQSCGFVTGSGIAVGFGASVTVQGNITNCPKCGGWAVSVEGALEIIEDGVKLFSGPDFTKDTLVALGLIVEDLRQQKITPPQAVEKLAKTSPKTAASLSRWLKYGVPFAGLMFTIAQTVFAWNASTAPNTTINMVVADEITNYYGSYNQPITFSCPIDDKPVNRDTKRENLKGKDNKHR